MDLIFNGDESYGVCSKKEGDTTIFECFTSVKERRNDDNIKIKKDRVKGNVNWVSTTLDVDTDIYPNGLAFVEISQIYDLEYNTNKWDFKLKYDYISFSGDKPISIKVNDQDKTASCSIISDTDKIITCSSEALSQTELIILNKKWISNDNLWLYGLNHNGIPLLATLKFISASHLKYENSWSFELVTQKSEGLTIPLHSTFSIDMKYDNTNEALAFCTETQRVGNDMTLLCIPKPVINKNSLIKLSKEAKSDYASVTWSPPIS